MQSPINIRSRELAAGGGRCGSTSSNPFAVSMGTAGDHVLIPDLLRTAGVEFSVEDFASRLDEPSYEPTDRCVIRISGKLVAHAQAQHRMGWFGGELLPCGGLIDLAVLPEYESTELGTQMLQSAEELLQRSGAVVALCNSNQTDLLSHSGWALADSQGWSQVCVRDLLTHLSPKSTPTRRLSSPKVRVWRKVELDALMPVYREASRNGWGAVDRCEPYWHWLCGRHSDSVVLVACGRAKSKKSKASETILAYAVIRGDHIVELRYQSGHESAGALLLARVCQDAIEQDRHALCLHTPATDRLHELLITAGGTWQSPSDNHLMAKLLNPAAWVEAMAPQWRSRLTMAGHGVSLDIGFHVEKQRYRLTISETGAQLQSGVRTAKNVVCQPAAFSALLLGCRDPRSMLAHGELVVRSNRLAQQLAILFPPVVYWQSPRDCNG